MIDLEKLITDKQDALRGRPRNWIDDWQWCINWSAVAVILSAVILTVLFVLLPP